MGKTRISLTIDPDVLAAVDAEARAAGLSRSAWLGRVNREAALRAQFERFEPSGGTEEFPAELLDRVQAVRTYWNSADAR